MWVGVGPTKYVNFGVIDQKRLGTTSRTTITEEEKKSAFEIIHLPRYHLGDSRGTFVYIYIAY